MPRLQRTRPAALLLACVLAAAASAEAARFARLDIFKLSPSAVSLTVRVQPGNCWSVCAIGNGNPLVPLLPTGAAASAGAARNLP